MQITFIFTKLFWELKTDFQRSSYFSKQKTIFKNRNQTFEFWFQINLVLKQILLLTFFTNICSIMRFRFCVKAVIINYGFIFIIKL